MRTIYSKILNHPKLIITLFCLTAVMCFFLKDMVAVNYDMADYLPPDAASSVALDVMNQEFDSGVPNASVMVKDVTVAQALEYKEKLLAVDGVTNVTWLDDAASVYQPLEMIDSDSMETYYKDNNALFSVTVDEEKEIEAVEAMREVVGDSGCMSGKAVSAAIATTSTVNEITVITVIAVAFVLFVLLITTTSWIEPLIIMCGLGVAIVINSGTNLIFGEISFVTNAAGSILQLAVSLDYSVFLIHRFEECKREFNEPKDAMLEALCKSTSSILSSGLTTVIGFLALVFMRFKIGPDLGVALAKGVAISLITVFVFMPVFVLALNKPLEKTRHRSFMPGFNGFARCVVKIMMPLACVFAVIVAPSYLASNSNSFYFGDAHIFGTDTQLGRDTKDIDDIFGQSDTYALLVSKGDLATEKELSDALHKIDGVKSIISYADTVGIEIPTSYLDDSTLSMLMSDNYSRMVITVDVGYEGDKTFNLVGEVRKTAGKYYPDYQLAGNGVSTCDLKDTITADMVKVNLIAIAAVFIVLLFTMKSVSLPIILVLGIETAIWINFSIPYFRGTTVFYISYLIVSSIQLGATVDYAILFTDRYMDNRKKMGRKKAIIETTSVVTVSMLTSGTVFAVVGFLLGYISTHGILSQLGMFLGIGTLVSLAIVLFVLPGLMYVLDFVISKTTIGADFYSPDKSAKSEKYRNKGKHGRKKRCEGVV